MRQLLGIALLACSLAGCYATRIVINKEPAAGPSLDYEGRFHHGLVYGLVELSEPVELDQVCPNGVAYIDQETTFLAGFIEQLAQGLYNPQVITIYCQSGKKAELLLNNGGKVIAMLPI